MVLKYAWDVTLIQTPLPLLAATIGRSGVLFLLLRIIAEGRRGSIMRHAGVPPYKVRQTVQQVTSPGARPVPARADPKAS